MPKLLVSAAAKRDLREIWRYSAKEWGPDRAQAYTDDLWAAMRRAAADPRVGRAADEYRQGYRVLPVRSHLMFFKLSNEIVQIVRFLGQRQDAARHL